MRVKIIVLCTMTARVSQQHKLKLLKNGQTVNQAVNLWNNQETQFATRVQTNGRHQRRI